MCSDRKGSKHHEFIGRKLDCFCPSRDLKKKKKRTLDWTKTHLPSVCVPVNYLLVVSDDRVYALDIVCGAWAPLKVTWLQRCPERAGAEIYTPFPSYRNITVICVKGFGS